MVLTRQMEDREDLQKLSRARNGERTEAATWMDGAVCQTAVLFVVGDW